MYRQNDFTDLIRWKMGEKHWTKRDLALSMQVSENYIYALLDGNASVNPYYLKKLSNSLGESPWFWIDLYRRCYGGDTL